MSTNPLSDANSKGVVVGLKQFGTQERLDIDVLLSKEPDTFNLFLLALKSIQEDEKWEDKMSFFQIAGIHGLPNAKWDSVDGKKAMTLQNGNQQGYCAHGVQTFPTWHRPYLAMLEQALYKKILDIVEKYTAVSPTRKAAYAEAAKKFRLPYWDYHRARDYNARFPGVFRDGTTVSPYDFSVPQILTLPSVKVKMHPDDKIVPIDNPLSFFKFPKGGLRPNDWEVTGYSETSSLRSATARWPSRPQGFSSAVQALNAAVNEEREDQIRLSLSFIENGAYNNYLTYATAGAFTTDPLDGKEASGSLESIHGAYHSIIAGFGGGHMGAVTTAAYDPIFWLHHCQIDRWFAIWQASHPTSWFAPPSPRRSDKSQPTDPLVPFRHPSDPSKFWDSNQSVKTDAFGYTYPDIKGIETNPREVRKRFIDLYSWARRLTPTPDPNVKPPASMEPLDLSGSPFFQGVQGFQKLKSKSASRLPRIGAMVANLPQVSFSVASAAAPAAFAVKAEAIPQAQAPISTKPEVEIVEKKVSREWYIDDVVQRLALNGSFSILYLIGDFNHNAPVSDLILAPTFAGLNGVFTAPVEACDNCGHQDQQAHLVTSTVPITSMLLDYVETEKLESMRAEHVKPFLVKNLKWRVVRADGSRVDPRLLSESKDFKISVSCKVAPLPGEEGEVVYESFPEISAQIIANAG